MLGYDVVAVVALVVLFRWVRRRWPDGRFRRLPLPGGAWFIGAGIALVLAPTLEQPWVPAEVLVLRSTGTISTTQPDANGQLTFNRYPTVFVLAEDDGGWTTALDAQTRLLLKIPSSNIGARVICRSATQLPASHTLAAGS